MKNDIETLKALYKTLKITQKKLHDIENAGREPVAIVGMACRFPGGASSIEKFRALLESGRDAICDVPKARWDGAAYLDADPEVPGKATTQRAGFLSEPIDGFDSAFFHLSPHEVSRMDPQQRLLLEVCWEALENAGIDITPLKGSRTAVFCGIANCDYAAAHLRSGDPEKIDAYSVTGTALSAAVGRISYLFGFEGPNMAIDTACSSSLVAVHLACQSLRSGESDMAIAAGINLILTPEGQIGFSKLRALSPDGRCKSFDDSADGYGRGEGCGLIVLKRLSDAIKEGASILAVIRGTAVNQDGRTNGFTAPSSLSQAKVLKKALEDAGLRPEDIDCIEAHGTGTPLGDPIEMEAIGKVYSPGREMGPPLYVGSVKAHIGHLEAAAGIAGLIKAVLMLHGGRIFPQIHFAVPSRYIPWTRLPVKIPFELMAWPRGASPRGVAVSAFGFSGTNANVILQEVAAPSEPPAGPRPERSHHILNLSANDRQALRDLALKYQDFLAETQRDTGDICYTASVGRTHFSHRLSVVGRTNEELRAALDAHIGEDALNHTARAEGPSKNNQRIVFLFTGQGSQYPEMGRDLYETQPVFRSILERCDTGLRPHMERPLISLLYEDDTASLHETRHTQPIIFAVEYALAKLLESWGIKPSLVVGHSIGEYVAATLAGVFELEAALEVVAARGRLVQSLPLNGSMAVIVAGEQRVAEAIASFRDKVSIAAVNAPRNTVISGQKEAIERLCNRFRKEGVASHLLKVSHAFHSCLLDPIMDAFKCLVSERRFASPALPIISNVTGKLGGPEMATSDYWTRHLREPVRFFDSMTAIGESGCGIFIEVGGTATLTSLGRQCLPGHEGLWLSTLGGRDFTANLRPGRIEGRSDWEPMLSCLAGLYTAGCDIDWEAFDRPYGRNRVVLPNYPFQRKRCWMDLSGTGKKWPALAVSSAVDDITESNPVIPALPPAPTSPRPSRSERIQTEVRRLMFQSSEIEIFENDGDTNLFELGFASLMIARLKDLIKRSYGLEVQMSWFYSRLDSFNKIVAFIEEESGEDGEPVAEPERQELSEPPAPLPKGEADDIINRQMDLMRQQLAVMSEQLQLLGGLPVRKEGQQKRIDQQKTLLLQDEMLTPQLSLLTPNSSLLTPNSSLLTPNSSPLTPNSSLLTSKRPEYVAYRGVTSREKLALTTRQQAHLKQLIERYTGLTAGSKARTQRYRPVFANTRNIAGFRPEWKEMIYQIIVDRAEGAHFSDVDGKSYLDITMGFGVYLFGHNPPFVQAALERELRKGTPIGPMSDQAGKVATLIHELTGVERVAFFNTGTEAVMAAVRMARTVTGRKKIVLFSGSYHGHFDGVLAVKDYDGPVGAAVPMSPGTLPEMVRDVQVLEYGSEEALQFIETHGRELAAVLVEPVQSRKPGLQPGDFLKKLREITAASRVALIFDEMIIGFRVHPGGGQAWFDVRADIVTYGKVVGGGMPIGVVAGKAHFMDAVDGGMWHYGDKSFPETENTFIAGTFNHHPLAMAGAHAVLEHLRVSGPELQENLNRRTGELAHRLNTYFEAEELPIRMHHFGSLFRIPLKGDQELLYYHLLSRGIYIWEGRNCFLSTAHTDADIDCFVGTVQESIEAMRTGGLFDGSREVLSHGKTGGTPTAVYPMSSAQKRLYVVSRMEGGESAYHLNGALFIDGALDPDRIGQCFQTIIDRHESLRTGFEIMDDQFVQRIHETVDFKVSRMDRSVKDIDTLVREFIRPFDLSMPPLIRVGLVRLSPERHFLIIDAHHMVIDGISLIILAQELMGGYAEEPLPPVSLRYRDYVAWEQQLLESPALKKQEAYWLERLSGKLPVLRLPLDYPRPERQRFEGGVVRFGYEREKTGRVKALARKTGSTPFMVLFAAFNVLLYRLSGQRDMIAGTSSSGRNHLGFESVFGMCTNTLAIRTEPAGEKSFSLFLDEVKKRCLEAFEHQDIPFERLIGALNFQRDSGRNPLFDVFFVYEEADNRVVKIKDLTFTPYEIEKQASAFDLLLEVIEEAGQLYLNMEYCSALFRRETIERFLRYFKALLDQITENPATLLGDFQLRSATPETSAPGRVIPRRPDRESLFPLSHHQDRLWFVEKFEAGYLYESSPVYYNMPLLIHFTGRPDTAVLEKSLNRIIESHEILRTRIVTSDGRSFQAVMPRRFLPLAVVDRPAICEANAGREFLAAAMEDIRRPFIMDQAPPARATLFSFGREEHLLVVTLHHIIADPKSMEILTGQIVAHYNGILSNEAPALPEPTVQFADVAAWEKETADNFFADKLMDLRLKLAGKIEPLVLPTDRPRPAIHTYHDGSCSFELSRNLSELLQAVADREGVTLYVLLLAAFQTLLYRYAGQETIVTGTPFSGRDRAETLNTIGPFANLLVIPSDFSGRPSFRDFLSRVDRSVSELFKYRDVPFDRVVLALNPEKDMSRTALFDVMFQLRKVSAPAPAMKDLKTKIVETNLGWGKYDLNLCMHQGSEGFSGIMVYNGDLFDAVTVEGMTRHYRVLLESIVKDPSCPVADLRLLTAEEEKQQIFEWNDTRASYPADRTIHRLFEEQVEKTPNRTAVVIGKDTLTYAELNRKANQLAHHLRKRGLTRNGFVCVCLDRSLELIVVLLAILKAGGAYVPLDPAYPEERLQFMLEDTGLPLVVTEEKVVQRLSHCAVSPVLIDAHRDDILTQRGENPANGSTPKDPAYVIYTSGSTGKPKGVLIEHRNVVRLMMADNSPFDFTENDVWTMFHSYCFDFSVWEMYGALLFGGKLVMVPKETTRDAKAFLDLLKAERVTILNQTPRSFYPLAGLALSLPDGGLSIRTVIFGGEALKPALLKGFYETYPEVKLINMYGITETTVHVTYKEITGVEIDANVSNVGRPIPTLTAYVADKGLKLLPVGVPGELLIGGDGVGRGYLNREELTKEKFIASPYREGERVYRSGDLARLLPNGEIVYLGRIDQQVKIRGYRIELGEIENNLLAHPQILQAAVIDREDKAGDRLLCAYLVSVEDLQLDTLRDYLGARLPEYMMPSRFFRIGRMPLTANGKTDKKALLSIEGTGLKQNTEFAGPQTEREQLLAGIWEAVLGREKIGVLDNYFALGGDSIKTIQILSRLHQQQLKLEVRQVFETPTIRALAKKLVPISRIAPQEEITGAVPLTAIQTWFFREHRGKGDHYAQAVWLCAKDPVDEGALNLSLLKLQAHHDALRMTFRFEGNVVIQENSDLEYPVDLKAVDLRGRAEADEEMERIGASVPASLHLNRGPVMKTVLFKRDDQDRILIVIHHLVVDGVSWRILMEDLGTCYEQALSGRPLVLPPKTDSFRSWAESIICYSQSPKLLEEIPVWRGIEENGALVIPPDFVSTTNRYQDGQSVSIALDADETLSLISDANSAYHTEINELLLAALGVTLKRCYGANRGYIEIEGHGREPLFDDIETDRTVGWFTSIYPVLIDIPQSDEPGLVIKQIKEGLRRIPNRGIGYGILKYLASVAEQEPIPLTGRSRILFNYLGSFDAGEKKGFLIDDRTAGNTICGSCEREHEIVLEGAIIGRRLKLSLSYNTKIHSRETVDRFLMAYRDELRGLISHCISRDTQEVTPQDLTWKELTLSELDHILSGCGISNANLLDIYPLSPLQEGMLFHALLGAGRMEVTGLAAAFFMQVAFRIDGELDPDDFETCWNLLVERHDILRTVFTHKGGDRPLQLVARKATLDFRFEDISGLPEDLQSAHLAAFEIRDRKEGFDLMVKVPMRVSVLKRSAQSFDVIWSYHHLLIDGWCAGILMSEFFEAYALLRRGGLPDRGPVPPYGTYIRWLENMDRSATTTYWRDYLQGYDHPAVLPKQAVETVPKGFLPKTCVLKLGPQPLEDLKRFATGHQVTVNTVIQTGWALVLSRFCGADDVVFGATVSGRPAQVAGIENMVGLFINTIPVRIRLDAEKTVTRLVREVQADALKSQKHHYGSLADIQAASSLKQNLLDHVLVFENYPLAAELIGLERKYPLGFGIRDVRVFEQTPDDLVIVVEPGETLRVEFRFNAVIFPAALMERVGSAFEAILCSIAGAADMRIGEFKLSLMSEAEKNERDAFLRSAQEVSEEF